MVRAILNLEIGSWPAKPIDASKACKWQTRRIGKTQSAAYVDLRVEYAKHATKGDVAQATHLAYPDRGTARHGIEESRLGIPGDRLWVRETWQDGDFALNEPRGAVYRATDPDWETMEGWKWIPSIHMPRWASRITLEVMEVSVQRLQEISEEDAIAEGLHQDKNGLWTWGDYPSGSNNPVYAFQLLWDSIYSKKHPWASNCWVWVYSFRRVK